MPTLRIRPLAVSLAILLVAGCGGSKHPAAEPTARSMTTTGTPPPPPTTTEAQAQEPPQLPRMQGDVLAVGRGSTDYTHAVTVFMTLDGRELARLPGYVPYGFGPSFSGSGPEHWTLRDGRVVRHTRRDRVIRVRGFRRRDCTELATVPAGALVSCYRGSGALLLRRPDGTAIELVNKPPHEPSEIVGYWANAYVSPDGTQLLLTWSRECESPTAFLAPAAGGDPTPFAGDADWRKAQESYALGWTRDGRALAYLTMGLCGPSGGPPGVYASEGGGPPTLVARGNDAAFFRG
jgi:hypothetical protein